MYNTDFFVEPQPKLNNCSLICGLDGNKMGKSFNNDIKISDTEEVTAKKIMSAITDRSRMRKDDPGHPEDCEVAFKYWTIFGNKEEIETVKCECEKGLRGCADCKRQLGAKINERFEKVFNKFWNWCMFHSVISVFFCHYFNLLKSYEYSIMEFFYRYFN